MLALIDGNSFYCSCERAFDPKLKRKPVVVLSNNDGCAIARTQEAKDLGIKMGEPYHLAKRRPGLEDVVWKSSNYVLYGDMSRRMYEVLTDLVPEVEPYSIDEMFLDVSGMNGVENHAIAIRAAVLKATKIPTCVGIGPTKTIAKLANAIAKKQRGGNGVCDLSDERQRNRLYETLPAEMVWGLGPAAVRKLASVNVTTIIEFLALSDDEIRKHLSVVGLRTAWELRGTMCLPFSLAPATRKSLAVTRSFGRSVETWDEMQQALASYATRAAEKLRRHGLVATAMQVFLQTNRFSKVDPQYVNQSSFGIEPTADTFALIASATRAGARIWRQGYRYAKAGVILLDLVPQQQLSAQLVPSIDPVRSAKVMRAMDTINMRFGRNTVRPAALAAPPRWSMRRSNVSPRYTTDLDELFTARA
ncbi:MAG: Y-family DNA polymerase [Alphaproteobacteria bacterium]|nr:Y-family DNA polymerase [Alphaproteobacteria bacterium]